MNRTKPSSQSRVAVDVALTNYFLLRFFKEHDHRFRHRVRILFGGSEEIALNDIKWFVANIGAPYQAIVTDGPFPVNNIQKGLLDVDVELPVGPQLPNGQKTHMAPAWVSIARMRKADRLPPMVV
ncbi:hypothetical protein CJO32_00120 [Bifidobacterium longum]|uniref:Uncharacterized protein n=1 Tax=Bifidobacterium longum TaxID=216816 RepID=A0A269TA62_BIFLN|nr:hypothetical protein [Bifidobacterium longum]MUV12177.1 hypothetical protein [Bifidobacterium longum]PAK18352.1 hypothetical protein CJO32_00120 [Bifidobacterium longum]QGV02850.1 hypothetical protein GN236_04250 [Bifidobacterium longum]RDX09501.1 hypothetical protein CE169_03865 [Bifidobacterium longum]RDX11544.1 hypothetical protein CE158_08955 [Bifidobacterium longum]